MKVTLNPDGTMDLDASPAEVVQLQAEIAQKRAGDPVTVEVKAVAPQPVSRIKPHLNDLQFATWEVLQAYDCEEGIHSRFVAEMLEVNESAANQRLQRLATTGDAKRVSRGKYRPL